MEFDSQEAGLDVETLDNTSQEYLGRWHSLVSTTNWEKGRIIHQWREALKASRAAPQQFSDESWSRRIGSVSGQHTGRLRRVFERFDAVRESYPGLYWSHFCAATEWDDAELWLEGAVQNEWSISEMRGQRAEAFGQTATPEMQDDPASEFDEDFAPIEAENQAEVRIPGEASGEMRRDVDRHESDAGEPADDEAHSAEAGDSWDFEQRDASGEHADALAGGASHAIPLALPADLAEAFDTLKLAILRHKLSGWREASREDVLSGLSALMAMAQAPSE
ncbi:MAG: hypothetical protein JSS27_12540 [Planctomycetes bacterium]|nr:hypothetical protein [Planctomycetota bacterium]